ncbi:MAG: DUF2796 domain-containing protein [Gammaproteobacteria bacterium]
MTECRLLPCATVGLALLVVSPVLATEDEHEEHGAHEHGAAVLNVVLEGNRLHLELETPAINIVGFEHRPTDGAQEQIVEDAAATLADGGKMFAFPLSADCFTFKVEVESALLTGHDEKHKEDADEEDHSEFHVVYEFTCSGNEVQYIDVGLFSLFPGTEEIEARVVTPSGQTSRKVTPDSIRINL